MSRRDPGAAGSLVGLTPSGSGFERRPRARRAFRTSLRVFVVVVVGLPVLLGATAASGFGLLLFGNLPGTVPEENPLLRSEPTRVYDSAGNEIGVFREFDLTVPMSRDDVPQVLKDAVVAAEDNNFWVHRGIDPQGLARAAVANFREGEIVQGGSTITQQYVRATYLTRDRTIQRKLNEAILATRVERELAAELGSTRAAKEEILFRYLDMIFFGGGAYGAGAAAQTYFRKDVQDLNLSEAATLAAVIPAPSRFGPRENVFLAELRRAEVLESMRELGLVSEAAYYEARFQPLWYLGFGPPPEGSTHTIVHPPPDSGATSYPFFVDYVRQYLIERYGEEQVFRGGLRVETTIDPRMQEIAERSVAGALRGTSAPLEMSLVSVEPSTGFVRAFVGGRDFQASQVNLALGGSTGMQPGSSFKPFTAAAALERGFGPDTVYNTTGSWTVPNCIGQCTVRGGAAGPIDMTSAMASSSNTYFAQLIFDVGPDRVAEMANRLGVSRITLDRTYGVSLTLGANEVSPLDMAASFGVLANHGRRAPATPVLRVTAPDGTVIEDNTDREAIAVLDPAIADTLTQTMVAAISGGTGRRADIGRPAAGKTGTAENYTAAWFVGYVPQLATAVWMGYSDLPRPLTGIGGFGRVMGGTIPARTWGEFMRGALDGSPVVEFAVPGPLPPPPEADGSAPVVRRPQARLTPPELPRDCGGPCRRSPELPAPAAPPTTTVPPPPSPPPPGDRGATTTTAPTTTTTTSPTEED